MYYEPFNACYFWFSNSTFSKFFCGNTQTTDEGCINRDMPYSIVSIAEELDRG